jgi:hypothetical protein
MLLDNEIRRLMAAKECYLAYIKLVDTEYTPNLYSNSDLVSRVPDYKARMVVCSCIMNKEYPHKHRAEFTYAMSLISS